MMHAIVFSFIRGNKEYVMILVYYCDSTVTTILSQELPTYLRKPHFKILLNLQGVQLECNFLTFFLTVIIS